MNQSCAGNADARKRRKAELTVCVGFLTAGVAALTQGQWLLVATMAFAITGLFVDAIFGGGSTSTESKWPHWVMRFCAAVVLLLMAYILFSL